jgi:hypothetical protein
MTPEAPLQWLIMFHPEYGAVSQWPILTDPDPKATKHTPVPFGEE